MARAPRQTVKSRRRRKDVKRNSSTVHSSSQPTVSSLPNTFQYSSLESTQPDAFRLLYLLPGKKSSPIKCSLKHTRRSEAKSSYRAVSYTWGEELPTETIFINGLPFKVRPNLESALRSFRENKHYLGRLPIWIDAVCIDQDSPAERNHQVMQMQEVYRDADEVIIWLGPPTSRSSLAMRFILTLCNRMNKIGIAAGDEIDYRRQYHRPDFDLIVKEFRSPAFQADWKALVELIKRPWWERVWVVQEVVNARRATLIYGNDSVTWPQMGLVLYMLRQRYYDFRDCAALVDLARSNGHKFPVEVSRALNLNYTRSNFRAGDLNFLPVILMFNSPNLLCKDPRDRVYSILGLLSPEIREIIIPDYSKPVAWAHSMLSKALIQTNKNMSILVDIGDGTSHLQCPSWVRDLGRKRQARYHYQENTMGFAASRASTCHPQFSEDLLEMTVDGFIIDVVENTKLDGIGGHLNEYLDFKGIFDYLQSSGGIKNVYESSATLEKERLRQGIEGALYNVLNAGHTWNFTMSAHRKLEINYPCATSSADDCPGSEEPKKPGIKDSSLPHSEQVEELEFQAGQWIQGRTVILTKERYLGLAPAATKAGDRVVILLGLRMPAILRPQENGSWQFVGVTYIPGLMEGEAMKDLEDGVYKMEKFVLR
jgi:hypothetical protein